MGEPTIAHLYRMKPLPSLAGGSLGLQEELLGLMRLMGVGKGTVAGSHEQTCCVPGS